MNIGIIGLGSFGLFLAKQLKPLGKTYGYSEESITAPADDILCLESIEELLLVSDVVILAIPFSSYEVVLACISNSKIELKEKLIVDVASVKVNPERKVIEALSGKTQLLISHPLFGPESAAEGISGHTFIVTHRKGRLADEFLGYLTSVCGVNIKDMSAVEHDRSMAYAHALTFFIGRALNVMDLKSVRVVTPSFQKLLDVAEIDSNHSDELYSTIVDDNPYAEEAISIFMKKAQELR